MSFPLALVGLMTLSLFVAAYGVATALRDMRRSRRPTLLRGALSPQGRSISSGSLVDREPALSKARAIAARPVGDDA